MEKNTQDKFFNLRKNAEEQLRERRLQQRPFSELSPDEVQSLVNELETHQIELEMQNEELRRAQIKLEEARDQYADLYDFAPVGYITISEKGLILETNLTACTLLGVERCFLNKIPFSRFIVKEDEDIYYLHRKQVVETREPQTCKVRIEPKDGNRFWVQMDSVLAEDSEGNLKCRTSITDITQQKEMEENLLQAKKQAEEANKLKDKFVSLVSHDLRGPLVTLSSFLTLLQDESYDAERKKDFLERLKTTTSKMSDMIDNLLKLSRFKMGKMLPSFSFFSAMIIVSQAAYELQPITQKKKIQIVNRIKEKTRIYADRSLLLEVLKNLISNAIKFCREGDTITISAQPGRMVSLAITDTGIGMEPKKLENIFKYEEITSTMGTDGELGTGLGLPLSKDIIDAHGGEIDVESHLGQGSVFTIRLPHIKPIVLIVDDEPIARKLLISSLQKLDVDFKEAGSGEKALEAMKQTTPHIIITDLIMPKMDGFEFIGHVKKEPKTAKIPIIVVTSDTDMKTREMVFAIGATDFITKPVTIEDLNPRVRRFLD